MTRRRFLRAGALGSLALGRLRVWPAETSAGSVAAAFDAELEPFMQARQVPGGALAVVKDRRLVCARGYGWADRDRRIPARPDTLFRIASLSKPLTATAVLQLAEQGRLELETRAFDLLKLEPLPLAGRRPDPRLAGITIRHLLQHTAGWDQQRSFDPMFRSRQIARAAGEPPPASPHAIIRFMLGRELDFEPGTRHAYSNFGYCVLGRIIEAVSGQPYESFVRQHILAPLGIRHMRLGRSLAPAEGEARYYTAKEATTASVFPNTAPTVPWPYGGFCLESMDAHGGWIASVVDLARFVAALNDPEHCPLLQPQTHRLMLAPPPPPVARQKDGALEPSWYGCGWAVRPVGSPTQANFWHAGSLPGSYGLLVRRWDRLCWAVLFNQRSEDEKLPDRAIDPALHRAAAAVRRWPDQDLFPQW